MGQSSNKKKPTAKENATRKMAERPDAPQQPKAGAGEGQRSQGRFPGERPLTGEDRPADKSGQKKEGQMS